MQCYQGSVLKGKKYLKLQKKRQKCQPTLFLQFCFTPVTVFVSRQKCDLFIKFSDEGCVIKVKGPEQAGKLTLS